MHWLQIGKGVRQGCVLSPCLFNLYAEYIMWNAGLDEAQSGIKTVVKNISYLRNSYDTTLMAESEEELKNLLMRVKRREWKSWFNNEHSKSTDHCIRSHHFTTNRWGNNVNSDRLFLEAPESLQMVTAAMKLKDTCSWKKSYGKPRHCILKQKHYFDDKGPSKSKLWFFL